MYIFSYFISQEWTILTIKHRTENFIKHDFLLSVTVLFILAVEFYIENWIYSHRIKMNPSILLNLTTTNYAPPYTHTHTHTFMCNFFYWSKFFKISEFCLLCAHNLKKASLGSPFSSPSYCHSPPSSCLLCLLR